MSAHCSACGSPLQDGMRFCSSCGTANEPTSAATPLIDEAPIDVAPGLATVTSERRRDAKAMPIVIGQQTLLEGAERAVKPEPVPWADGSVDPVGSSGFKSPPLRGRELIAALLVAFSALLIVPAVGSTWISQTFHDPAKVSAMFGDLHKRPSVAQPIGQELAEDLVANHFVKPSARDEAATKATTFIRSSGFDLAWDRVVRTTQTRANTVAGGDEGEIGLDLTPVVDHLRRDGVADATATVSPILLTNASDAPTVRKTSLLVTLGIVVGWPVVLIFLVAGLVLGKHRLRAWRIFGLVLAICALASMALAFVVPGMTVGAASSPAARTLQSDAIGIVAVRLALLSLGCVVIGVALTAVTTVVIRRRQPSMATVTGGAT